jgi:hypothetical protein
MLLAEKKIWDIVDGRNSRPKSFDEHKAEEQATMNPATKKNVEKAIAEWDEKNDEGLRIISFMLRFLGPRTPRKPYSLFTAFLVKSLYIVSWFIVPGAIIGREFDENTILSPVDF